MYNEYFILGIYLLLALIITLALLGLSFVFVLQTGDSEKLSAYECGFNPFGDARSQFDVRFYIVAILFVIFDVEIIFLLPGVVVFLDLGGSAFLSVGVFMLLVITGLVFELVADVLER